MSINQRITQQIKGLPRGKPFSTGRFLTLGSRSAVDKSLSRLVEKGVIERVTQGVYVRPKSNRFVGSVKPDMNKVVDTIAKSNGETLQVHGAEALRRFKLSTQVPTEPIFYTSGSTRILKIGELQVRFVHATWRKLQLAGKRSGLALSALWFMGRDGLNQGIVEQVCSALDAEELRELLAVSKPAWLSVALTAYCEGIHHV